MQSFHFKHKKFNSRLSDIFQRRNGSHSSISCFVFGVVVAVVVNVVVVVAVVVVAAVVGGKQIDPSSSYKVD